MRKLRWRPRAHLDRESIALYLGMECGSPQAALAAIRKIDTAIERVLAFPDLGGITRSPGRAGREYRTALASPYTIYYRYDATAVTIYRILHQRQEIDTYTFIDFE